MPSSDPFRGMRFPKNRIPRNERAGNNGISHALRSSHAPPEVIPRGSPLCDADSAKMKSSAII